LLVIAGCCGVLGIVLCALCAHSLTEPGCWLLLAPAAAVASLAASPDRVASYCRFSNKNQDDRTIADQLSVPRSVLSLPKDKAVHFAFKWVDNVADDSVAG
jgi:hypothetical protein